MASEPVQVTLDESGELRTEPLPTVQERHEQPRLFAPAPEPMKGQTTLDV